MFIFNKEIVRKIFSRSIVKIVTILSLTSLVQAAQFHLPTGTPGLQKRRVGVNLVADYEQKPVNTVNVNCEKVECVVGVQSSHPNDPLYLYFPTNGVQPTTEEAGEYSGARYNGPRKDDVTDWWVRVFGGNNAVNWSKTDNQQLTNQPQEEPMGFKAGTNEPIHIIRVNGDESFKKEFWQAFRTIAADPVGRVLLYRLLIEIRRLDGPGGNGCCGDDVVLPGGYVLTDRNNCRSIEVRCSINGCSFSSIQCIINFVNNNTIQTTTLRVVGVTLTTSKEARPSDIGLFHEMLHWFHFLRNPKKQIENKSQNSTAFKYAMRCYYGPSELCLWGNINSEEIATILGSPNLNQNPNPYAALIHSEAFLVVAPRGRSIFIQNHGIVQYILSFYKYLHGDDLSENAYRASRGKHMRFGHGSAAMNPVPWPNPPDRFQLAYRVAYDCYFQITGNAPYGWFFGPRQALNN